MLSRVIPLEYLKQRDVMFWLPPGGHDNDVWADTWVIIAELEPADAEPVLDLLRDNDIGAYIASPSGHRGAATSSRQLYVDRDQHTKATDVLMLFLRMKGQPAAPARATKKPKRAQPDVRVRVKRSAAFRAFVLAIKMVMFAALLALLVLLAYYEGPRLFPTVHPAKHPAPTADVRAA